jgi:hypothetical protein
MAAVVWCAGAGTSSHAEGLPDPTRPPPVLRDDAEHAGGRQGAGLVLQSVLLAPERKAAVISGKLVMPGARVSGLTLVRLTETEATLAGPEGLVRLHLHPGVSKRRPGDGVRGAEVATHD